MIPIVRQLPGKIRSKVMSAVNVILGVRRRLSSLA